MLESLSVTTLTTQAVSMQPAEDQTSRSYTMYQHKLNDDAAVYTGASSDIVEVPENAAQKLQPRHFRSLQRFILSALKLQLTGPQFQFHKRGICEKRTAC